MGHSEFEGKTLMDLQQSQALERCASSWCPVSDGERREGRERERGQRETAEAAFERKRADADDDDDRHDNQTDAAALQ